MLGRIYNQRAQCFEKLKRCASPHPDFYFGGISFVQNILGVTDGRRLFRIMIMQSTQSQQAGVGLRCMRTGPRSRTCLVRTYSISAVVLIMLPLPSVQSISKRRNQR
jgi:hypothetical protein|eukprot:COSAG02_NODE_8215_length_2655_cov_2.022692_4_plen_107_part_00